MNLPMEFALLGYADDGKAVTDSTHLDNGLGGALLLELALSDRIDIADKKVVVRDSAPTGDPLVDQALERIAGDGKARKADHWVSKFAKDTRGRVLDQLVADGVLQVEHGSVMWVFPRTTYPAPGGVEPPAETEARGRMRSAVAASGAVDARTAALCALVAATGLDRKVFPDLDRKQVKARLKEIGEGDWAAAAVKKAIQDVETAVMVAVVAATSASAASAGS
jgi:Golgi phosphoprotein 3 GPP34